MGFECALIFDNNNTFAGIKVHIRECEVYSLGEFYQVKVQCGEPGVFQFNEFLVRIIYIAGVARIEHNLGNSQVLFNRADGKISLVQRTPSPGIQITRFDFSALVQRYRYGILNRAGGYIALAYLTGD